MLVLATVALATEPVLLPLTADPVVGDRTARAGIVGSANTGGGADASAILEVAIVSRVAIQARAGATLGSDEPLLGGQVSVEILDEATSPVGLGAAVRYTHVGFDEVDSEVEIAVSASREVGPVRLVANVVGGKDVPEPEGDVEGGLSGVVAVGSVVGVGVDTRVRAAVGEAEDEEREIEQRRGWDLRGGGVVTVGTERISGFGFAGAEVVGAAESAQAGALFSLGVQVTL